jgi:hypothetical protein
MKNIVCAVTVTLDMLHYTWMEIEYCLNVCRVRDGAHIETQAAARLVIVHYE